MVGRGLLDHGVRDVEPELGGRGFEDLGQPPALERRGRALPEPLVHRGEGGDEFVLTGRIEPVGGEAPEIEQVGSAEVARGEGSAPVEDHSLPPPRARQRIGFRRRADSESSETQPVVSAAAHWGLAPNTSYHLLGMSVPTRTVPVPASLVLVAERVEHRLAELLDTEIERWGALDADLVDPLLVLRRFVVGSGKRLRPAFCHWAYVGAGGDDDSAAVIDIGAAFELLQAFALVHDDVMDGSATRRGARTVHLDFGDRHVVEGWRGEPRRFGEGVAILVGDLAHVYADHFVAGAPDEVAAIWNELRVELNVGQYLDVLGTARGDTDLPRARRIARYKSGKYTIERPLHVGAALAGRYDELHTALSAYGDPLGEAFQLRDDMLGAFGEESVTGKPVGDDLREGKPTPLLAVATARADREQRAVLGLIGQPDLSPSDVAAVQAVLIETGAVSEIEATIDRLTTYCDLGHRADADHARRERRAHRAGRVRRLAGSLASRRSPLGGARAQDVSDLGEKHGLFGQGRLVLGLLTARPACREHVHRLHDEEEHRQRDQQERDQVA